MLSFCKVLAYAFLLGGCSFLKKTLILYLKISVAREKCVDSENLDWEAACDSGNKSSEQEALPAGY